MKETETGLMEMELLLCSKRAWQKMDGVKKNKERLNDIQLFNNHFFNTVRNEF